MLEFSYKKKTMKVELLSGSSVTLEHLSKKSSATEIGDSPTERIITQRITSEHVTSERINTEHIISCALTVLAETVVRLRLRLPPPAS